MTRRQAVIEALEHREHETIPFHMDFTKQALDQLIAYTKDDEKMCIRDRVSASFACTARASK